MFVFVVREQVWSNLVVVFGEWVVVRKLEWLLFVVVKSVWVKELDLTKGVWNRFSSNSNRHRGIRNIIINSSVRGRCNGRANSRLYFSFRHIRYGTYKRCLRRYVLFLSSLSSPLPGGHS